MRNTEDIIRLAREYKRAVTASEKAATARASLPPGTSRARITTANARWMRAAEHRDRVYGQLAKEMIAWLGGRRA